MRKRLVSVFATVALVASFILGGCASGINTADTVVTIGDTKITYGMANFLLRMQQASYDSYRSYFGNDMWETDQSGEGKTLGESVKENIIDTFKEACVLEKHMEEYKVEFTEEDAAKAKEAAKAFCEKNAKALKGIAATTQEDVEAALRLLTIQQRMATEIKKGANKNVSDTEAAQRTFSYTRLNIKSKQDESGNSVDLTDDEVNQIRKDAADILAGAKNGGDFSELTEEKNGIVTTYSYGKDESSMDAKVIAAADKLKENEYSEVIETEQFLYILRLDKKFDEEATKNKKESIIKERETEIFTKVTEPWLNEVEVKIEEAVWSKVKFDRILSMTSDKTTN